ncbi:TMEM175 family protein [Polluticoccus soli]|uniref:TMEM175 family protein n=1 Tax=Polluticoccus soli TaxID=3034150 RepID=UPI0023E212FA|nr:TMEM175 family protein [Flavipsychrobacter sp. JY13-12]
MTKSRLEAFSDGVIAIIITIMVLELKIPHEATLQALSELWPIFLSYLLSFIFVAIYWGNHHHLLHTVHHVTSGIIWSNMGLLFMLSLIPFTTGWMGENHFANTTIAVYSFNLLLAAIAFYILQKTIMAQVSNHSKLVVALKKQEAKGFVSVVLYIIAVVGGLYYPFISGVAIGITTILWLIPDKRIEAALSEERATHQ